MIGTLLQMIQPQLRLFFKSLITILTIVFSCLLCSSLDFNLTFFVSWNTWFIVVCVILNCCQCESMWKYVFQILNFAFFKASFSILIPLWDGMDLPNPAYWMLYFCIPPMLKKMAYLLSNSSWVNNPQCQHYITINITVTATLI